MFIFFVLCSVILIIVFGGNNRKNVFMLLKYVFMVINVYKLFGVSKLFIL